MKYIEQYRNTEKQKEIIKEIHKYGKLINRNVNIMEVCGTHTMIIGKYGIRKLMPENINLISGPGCPVCVTPINYIDTAIELSKIKDVIIVTFGDMMKVPGSFSSLEKEKANHAEIFVVYSPIDALKIAQDNKDKKVIFLSVGFETTTPLIAQTLKISKEKNIKNFYILAGNKLIPPVMEFLLREKDTEIDGFICPGHVSVIIGLSNYISISERFNVPCVISGFEPFDILLSIYLILKSIKENDCKVINEYKRTVRENGNIKARKVMYEVFDVVDDEWRGIGLVKNSGLKPKDEFLDFDAEKKFKIINKNSKEKKECLCGEVLKGKKSPFDCPLFEKICNPENPYGPCMVSSEGTCSAYYKYERK
ncbi:MAG: hydrogenase formation protein HypD [Candidatus Omnitrophica bacterium]|nr:hydrogenase formation protein HypD [Candidatus Omnitrophota bacterium]MCM8833683.1 hydrogenase formation protein HypD [Candidatus Omnitrophota bacterium]